MGLITEFNIRRYSDISKEIRDIEKKIPIPSPDKKPANYVFDEGQTVRWNREQVDIYNHKNSGLRREARGLRIQSYRNLDKAVVNYVVEYEALETTPRSVIEKVVAHAKQDHDEWWNYLSRYLEFAEDILSVIKED